MNHQFDDLPLLQCFFQDSIPLSSDLQRLILDHLYVRKITSFEKNGINSRFRLGLTLVSGKLAYEIRAYNQNEKQVFSTFAIADETLAELNFETIWEKVVKETDWSNVFFSSFNSYDRFVFSPVTDKTYVIHSIQPPGEYYYIMVYPHGHGNLSYNICVTKEFDKMKIIMNGASRMLVREGEWWKCEKSLREILE